MKTRKILAVAALVLSVLLIVTAMFGANLRSSSGASGEWFSRAAERESAVSAHEKAADKTAPSAVKKGASAEKAAEKAVSAANDALDSMNRLSEALSAGEWSDELVRLILLSSSEIAETLNGAESLSPDGETITFALAPAREALLSLSGEADARILKAYQSEVNSAYKAVSDAENQLENAYKAVADVYDGCGLEWVSPSVGRTSSLAVSSPEEAVLGAQALAVRAGELTALSKQAVQDTENAQTAAENVKAGDFLSFSDRLALLMGRSFIGIMFTGVVLLAVGIVAFFFSGRFLRAWKRVPVFSTFISALVMILIQTYSLGFRFEAYGEWGAFWLSNMLNVLRSNAAVGMIALGMTFVIITGGIDLAVGSTLAGISTVVMVLLDTSSSGILTGAGITGLPAYVIAIAAGLLTGVLLGAFTGAGITKGRIPPFIFTLGTMNIIRSVAQYFTKSYKPEVPKGFQVIANAEVVGGQMLLPILYWLILAVIMYVIANHTAFGRHIYAVGSNERTSRLSGINVNRVKMKVYILMGLIVAIASVVSVARLRGVDVASAGNGYEMNAIAAVIVGGTSMTGGRGSIIGTMLGVLIIGIMSNLLVLLHIDAFLSQAFTGAIIIFAVFLQRKERV